MNANVHSLEELIRHSGEGWILDWFKPREKAVEHLKRLLEQVNAAASQRFPGGSVRLAEKDLIADYQRSRHKVRAFIQSMSESRTPEMLLMVWRVLQGMEIERIDMRYILGTRFELEVALRSPYGDPPETYKSDDIDDAALIRHFGIMKMNGGPVFDGFYATRSER